MVSPKLLQMIPWCGDCAETASAILVQKHAFSFFFFLFAQYLPGFRQSSGLHVYFSWFLSSYFSISFTDYSGQEFLCLGSQLNIIFFFQFRN